MNRLILSADFVFVFSAKAKPPVLPGESERSENVMNKVKAESYFSAFFIDKPFINLYNSFIRNECCVTCVAERVSICLRNVNLQKKKLLNFM